MAEGNAVIRSTTNSGICWLWTVDGEGANAATGAASYNAALDSIKTLAAALPGSIKRIVITVTTS